MPPCTSPPMLALLALLAMPSAVLAATGTPASQPPGPQPQRPAARGQQAPAPPPPPPPPMPDAAPAPPAIAPANPVPATPMPATPMPATPVPATTAPAADIPAAPPPLMPLAPPAPPVIPPPLAVPSRPLPPPVPVEIVPGAPGVAIRLGAGWRITFGPGLSQLNSVTAQALRDAARALPAQASITVSAFAPGTPEDPSTARRLSLARALAVRGVLIAEGIASPRILVRALGAGPAIAEGPPDRVDLVPTPSRPAP